MLASPDYKKPFLIQCDASKLGVGAVLAQVNDKGEEMPIAYFSKTLNKAQSNYSVTELECLAAILAIKKFRAYVEGQEFTVITDHASLKWLMRQPDLSGRLARWSLKLQGYKLKILHRRGTQNVVPDCLSRQNFEEISELELLPIVDLESPEFESEDYQKLRVYVQENQSRLPDLQIEGNKIYKRTEHPDGDVERENAHNPPNKCHGGIAKTLERLMLNLYWPDMAVDVKTFISSCDICQKTKAPNTILRPPMSQKFQVKRPFQQLYIDLLGPYPRSKNGNIGMLIIVDHLTKFTILIPLKKLNSSVIIKCLREQVLTVFWNT